MKRLLKPVALALLITGAWLAGTGMYHIKNPNPAGLPAKNEVQQDNRPIYQPPPSSLQTTAETSQTPRLQPAEPNLTQQPENRTVQKITEPKASADSGIRPEQNGAAGNDASRDQAAFDTGQVVLVFDGDTINVKINGQKVKVRLIGIDTPELDKNEFGITAADYTRKLLQGKNVKLVYDKDRADQYGRTLAYVYLPDGAFVNAKLVEEGYARVMTIPPNTAHAAEFEELQAEAQKARRGIWADPPPPCTWRGSKVIKTWYFNDAGSRRLYLLP